ncbi:hypothetical protein [Tenacibaculum sp. 190524A02b]|uniref:hypothetical protein n=1 Tax=Tenacibaculum vairaonense TaxID=3137860 RepID=UPI0031FAB7C1
MGFNIYKLKNGLKPVSWQVPLKGLTLEKFNEENGVKVSLGQRRVKYVPGANTIFEEDLKGDYRSKTLWFENGELRLDETDLLGNYIMEEHPLANIAWYLWTEDGDLKDKLEVHRLKDRVRELISDSDGEKLRAVAIAIFGYVAMGWTENKSEYEVRNYADKEPLKLEKELNSKDYQSKYLAALAFGKKIVTNNLNHTAVIWNDTTQGVIVHVPKGDNGISKLGELLSKSTEESQLILQTINEKIQKIETKIPSNDNYVNDILKQKDREIEELKMKLANKEESNHNSELEDLRQEYVEIKGAVVPARFKNNPEWIAKKIEELKEEVVIKDDVNPDDINASDENIDDKLEE